MKTSNVFNLIVYENILHILSVILGFSRPIDCIRRSVATPLLDSDEWLKTIKIIKRKCWLIKSTFRFVFIRRQVSWFLAPRSLPFLARFIIVGLSTSHSTHLLLRRVHARREPSNSQIFCLRLQPRYCTPLPPHSSPSTTLSHVVRVAICLSPGLLRTKETVPACSTACHSVAQNGVTK